MSTQCPQIRKREPPEPVSRRCPLVPTKEWRLKKQNKIGVPDQEMCSFHMAHSYSAILLNGSGPMTRGRRATQIAGLVTAIFSNYARRKDDGRRAVRLLVSASERCECDALRKIMDLQFSVLLSRARGMIVLFIRKPCIRFKAKLITWHIRFVTTPFVPFPAPLPNSPLRLSLDFHIGSIPTFNRATARNEALF